MRIGVVIPAYNAADWVGDAVASVLAQTHGDWRLVVVDDGSADTTGAIVRRFADPRVALIRQANAGVSIARNAGIAELFRGTPSPDSLLFLDSDDRLAPDALARLAAALGAAPNAVAATGGYILVVANRARRPPAGELLPRLLVRNLFANPGHVLIRGNAVRQAGGFLPRLAFGEDWEFLIRVALQGVFTATKDPAPVLFVWQHAKGAYQRLAADPASFVPCMNAIFCNPDLCVRFGSGCLAEIRRRTEAENQWIIGRALIKHGRNGIPWLRQSVLRHPTPKRAALLVLLLLSPGWRRLFRRRPNASRLTEDW